MGKQNFRSWDLETRGQRKEGAKMTYLVEVIRYGNPSLGVNRYGIFDDFAKIASTMASYNSYRGGKYPAYFVTEFSEMNPTYRFS